MATCEQPIGGDLVLRTIRDEADVERYITLSAAVVGESERVLCERVLRHRPGQTWDDFLLVEDRATGQVASTTNLMPWRCRYEQVELDAAMLEMVVTHPGYRRRGLVRAQVAQFHRRAAERGFDFTIIQGIPFYYRQFGYAYALDHSPRRALPAWRVPEAAGSGAAFRMRSATVADAPLLTRLHAEGLAGQAVCVLRDEAYWRYLLAHASWPVRLIEGDDGRAAGYLCAFRQDDGAAFDVDVIESAVPDHEAGLAALRQLKSEGAREVRIGGSDTTALAVLGRSLGAVAQPAYQWLARLTDAAAFLMRIAPALERRLAEAGWPKLDADLRLNLYREACVLRFRQGRLAGVERAGFVDASLGADGGDLCLPPDAFVRLAFGYRALDALRDAWPDTQVKPGARPLVEALFPPVPSLVWMPY